MASSIWQHTDFHAMPRNSPFAAELLRAAEKCGIVFVTFMYNSRFFGLLFNFAMYIKQ